MNAFRRACLSAVLLTAPLEVLAGASADPPLRTMQLELQRMTETLGKSSPTVYFLSYQVTDNTAAHVSASFGALTSSRERSTRTLDVDLRVGDYSFDSSHAMRGAGSFDAFEIRPTREELPLDDNPEALRVALWLETERKYRDAVRRFEKAKANVGVKITQEDRSGDFSRSDVEAYVEPVAPFTADRVAWERRLRALTEPFAKHDQIVAADAWWMAERETRRYVNSEGTTVQTSTPFYRLMVTARAKAADGMELPLQQSYMSFRPDGFPDDATLARDVERMIRTLLALTKAPVAEPYTGPAILSGRAAAVFFHEIFGHRIEGQRQKNEEEAQTFKKKLNRPVLPPFMSVYSDPSLRQLNGLELVGYYPYDDEGVKAQRVTVVKDGVLKAFLMSRSPIEGFDRSNGHGRRQQGNKVVARQSNLLVRSSRSVPRAELKRMLIQRTKATGKPYGLLFDDIEGGFTFTARILPNAFNVRPTVVYRVYPDGKEELVRGVDLIGTPLMAFSKIVATDDAPAAFNGVCGAESGWVPVSAVSPGLLVSQIEVQRKEKSQERSPLLPPPAATREE